MDIKASITNFFSRDLCFNLRRASNPVSRACNRMLKSRNLPLTSKQYYMLIALLESHPRAISFTELGEILFVDRTTVTRVIVPLVKKGLVTLSGKKIKDKAHRCMITELGKEYVIESLPVLIDIDDFFKSEIALTTNISYSNFTTKWMEELKKIGASAAFLNENEV